MYLCEEITYCLINMTKDGLVAVDGTHLLTHDRASIEVFILNQPAVRSRGAYCSLYAKAMVASSIIEQRLF